MNTTTENLTEPLRVNNPIPGDEIKYTNNTTGLIVITTYSDPIVIPQEEIEDLARAVSYTHLTLPTIYSV